MTHDESHVSELLPDYLSGHLGQGEVSRVARHVQGCYSCRSELETMRLIAEGFAGKRMAEDTGHISEQELWQYYNDREALEETTRTDVESHLGHCFECSSALDLLIGLEQDLVQSHSTDKIRAQKANGLIESLTRFLRRPVLAYALLALTVYPAIRWMVGEQSPNVASRAVRMPERAHRLAAQLRSANEAPIVTRYDHNEVILFELPFYALTEVKSYSVTIADTDAAMAENRSIESVVIPGAQGIVNVLMTTAKLSDGSYDLALLEIDKNNPSDTSTAHFAFQLKTTEE